MAQSTDKLRAPGTQSKTQPAAQPDQNETEQLIPINGFEQVLEMLRAADPAFRESLLRGIAQRDPKLAYTLKRDLRDR